MTFFEKINSKLKLKFSYTIYWQNKISHINTQYKLYEHKVTNQTPKAMGEIFFSIYILYVGRRQVIFKSIPSKKRRDILPTPSSVGGILNLLLRCKILKIPQFLVQIPSHALTFPWHNGVPSIIQKCTSAPNLETR